MKRIIILFITILIIYVFLKFILHDFILGHDISYQLKHNKNIFEIKEVLNLKKDQEVTNYFFEITINKTKFAFKINNEFNKDMKTITQIKYFKNDKYECLLPIFKKDKTPLDMMCYYKNKLYFNYNLPEKDQQLNEFIESIEAIYHPQNWRDKNKESTKKEALTLYHKNILDNHYVVLDNYRGIYIVDKTNKLTQVDLFDDDVYETKIKKLVDKNYVIADYNSQYDFNQFYTVDITNAKKDKVVINYDVSFDSYINGSHKNSLFLVDKNAKLQYEFNLKTKDFYIAGDQSEGVIIYNNDQKTTVKMNDALKKEYKFNNKLSKDKRYAKIDQIAGSYYLYEKSNNTYHVYKAPIEAKGQTIYLFDTDNLQDIYYTDNYIYFRKGNDVLYYHDNIGVKTLFSDNEYEFNPKLQYYVYVEV